MIAEHPPSQQRTLKEEANFLAMFDQFDAFDFDPDGSFNIVIDNDAADDADSTPPFMLGDYSEKELFPPSTNVVRNEILEVLPSSETDTDRGSGKSSPAAEVDIGMAFRCVHCKHAEERLETAVIRPQNLASIHQSFLRFQRTHVEECTYIPSDVRTCYLDFKAREDRGGAATPIVAGDPWVSSAIRRGLRDAPSERGGGIAYCPELAVVRETREPQRSAAAPRVEADNVRDDAHRRRGEGGEPHRNDVLVGRGNLANKHPGNIYWRRLMKEVKNDYIGVSRSAATADGKSKKSIISRLVVRAVRNQSPPGRFLFQDKETLSWYDIGDKEAMKKTKQALRDMGKAKHPGVAKSGGVAVVTSVSNVPSAMEIDVKQESKKRTNHVLNQYDVGKAPHERNEDWEITNLLNEEIGELSNEEIGEWFLSNDPSPLPPRKKHKLLETPTRSKRESNERHVAVPSPTCVSSVLLDRVDEKGNCTPTAAKKLPSPAPKNRTIIAGNKSGYNGVTAISKSKGTRKYEARYSGHRLGSYVLRADAALAYDGYVRSSGRKSQYSKLNFLVEQEYLDAREDEWNAQGGGGPLLKSAQADFEDVLEYISKRVESAVRKTRR